MYPSGAPPLPRWEQFVNCSELIFNIINFSNPNSLIEPGYTFNETQTFRNGTAPLRVTGSVDLFYGAGLGATFFISPGLKGGDYIYDGAAASGNYSWIINETEDMSYWPGVPVCVLNYTRYTPNENSSSPLVATQTTLCWDQRTGVLLGAYEAAMGVSQATGIEISGVLMYELIANNVNIPTNYPTSLDLTPFCIVGAVGVIIIGVLIVRSVVGKSKAKNKRLNKR
jgi:hypothetical protein